MKQVFFGVSIVRGKFRRLAHMLEGMQLMES